VCGTRGPSSPVPIPPTCNRGSWSVPGSISRSITRGVLIISVGQAGPSGEVWGWKRILQTPTTIAILNDDLTYRVIHMDGRELEANAAPS